MENNNYNLRLDLKKFKNAGLVQVKGRKCVLIPVEDNPEIFVGEKGIYLSLTAYALNKPSDYGDTHLIKGHLNSDAYKAMSEEQRKALPIIGNMGPFKTKEMAAEPLADEDVEEDLPF